jgi:translation initiation factor 1
MEISMKGKKRKVVYSTERGDLRSEEARRLPKVSRMLPEEQTAAIRREKKGRGGKEVTVIYDLQLMPEELKMVAKTLKQRCGTGGTIKDKTIEIQGDHRQAVAAELQRLGYKTKFTGG